MTFKSLFYIIPSVLLIGVSQSCKTDFEINAPYDDIPVIYAALDQSIDTQYVKINKTYLGDGNNTLYANINDSILFPNLSATIDEVKNGSVTNSYLLSEKWVKDIEPGLFNTDSQKVYYFVPNGGLDSSATYKLTLNIDEGRKTATATTNLVEGFSFSQIFKQQLFAGVGFKNGNGNYSNMLIKWSTAKGALLYELGLRFHFDEYYTDGSVASKQLYWSFGVAESLSANGGEDLTKEVKGDGFYKFIQANLKDVDMTNINKRVVTKIVFNVAAAGEDLSTYISVNLPSNSIVADRPNFSNIEGGLGVFSSRTNLILDEVTPGSPLLLNFISQEELKNGQYTGTLKFQP